MATEEEKDRREEKKNELPENELASLVDSNIHNQFRTNRNIIDE